MRPEEAIKAISDLEVPAQIQKLAQEGEYGIILSDLVERKKVIEIIDQLKDEEAHKKQKAIKPRYYIDNWGHNRPGCPGCPRNEILYAGQKYCSVCGTKIDWSED